MTEKTYQVGVVGLTGISANRPSADPQAILNTPMPHSHVAGYAVVPQTRLVAVCELRTELFDQFKQRWGDVFPDVQTYTDYREMIALINQTFREGTDQDIRTDYPLVFEKSKLEYMRILKVDDRVVSHVPVAPREVAADDDRFMVGISSHHPLSRRVPGAFCPAEDDDVPGDEGAGSGRLPDVRRGDEQARTDRG